MKIKQGNLWESPDKVILFTGNSYINNRGELVMGRGAALEAKIRYKYLPLALGQAILNSCGHLGRYGLIFPYLSIAPTSDKTIGAFQTKYHFKDRADLDLISLSCLCLSGLLFRYDYNLNVSMNFPGIGYGQRTMKEIMPIIARLPDNVTLYIKENDETDKS